MSNQNKKNYFVDEFPFYVKGYITEYLEYLDDCIDRLPNSDKLKAEQRGFIKESILIQGQGFLDGVQIAENGVVTFKQDQYIFFQLSDKEGS